MAAEQASAVLITHSTAGVQLNDGFESNAVGADPAGWTISSEPVASSIQVVDNPTAHEGTKSLSVFDGAILYQNFASPLTSGVLTANFAIRVGAAGSENTIFTLMKHTAGAAADAFSVEQFLGFVDNEYVSLLGHSVPAGTGAPVIFNGSAYSVLKLGGNNYTFSLDAWHEVLLSYNIDTQTLSVTVDGSLLDALPADTTSIGQVNGFLVRGNSGNGGGRIDAVPVPEPAGVAAIALGTLAAVSRRRRS